MLAVSGDIVFQLSAECVSLLFCGTFRRVTPPAAVSQHPAPGA